MTQYTDTQVEEMLSLMRSITNNPEQGKEYFESIYECIDSDSLKLQAKAICTVGEMGFHYSELIDQTILSKILALLHHEQPLIRQRALCALGRIGRSNGCIIEPHLEKLLSLLNDIDGEVRMNVIWASENIATTHPEYFAAYMDLFSHCLEDTHEKTRMEAPEIFRVLGKRRPDYVLPYISKLQEFSQNDTNRVVRIHAAGAVRVVTSAMANQQTLIRKDKTNHEKTISS